MKLRKILVIGLVLMLGVSMMVMATGQSSGSSSGATTIRVWANDAHNKAEFDTIVERFNNTIGRQKGIQVEYTVYGADWQTAMNLALETNRQPEMFKGVANIPNFIQQGKLIPWTEIPGIEHILRAQEPYHRNQSTIFNGVIYSVTVYGWYAGFHYNKSLLQRAGYSAPPRTWAEFEEAAIKIAQLEPGRIYGYAMPLVWSPDFAHWPIEYAVANSIGHLYYNAAVDRYQFADYAPYYEMLSRIRNAGAMFPGMENLSDDQQRAQFAAGNIGFISGAGWNVGVLYEQFPFQGDLNGWDYAPLPVQNPNQVYATPISAGAQYYCSALLRNDRAKLNAMADVIELFIGDDTQRLMFTAGKHVPVRADISASAAPSERSQWTSYGRVLGNLTVTMPGMPHDYLAVEGADRVATLSQILTGQIPIQNIRRELEALDQRYNAALQQAYTRGVIDRANFYDPTFDAKFRGR
jgi:multiple sugar transport system substrate-binding protein